ncbi:MAG: cupin domain-containing protein [Magnetococcales bacterium]|nr:cupin domain-containing protein [Magnetococcales bacterium]
MIDVEHWNSEEEMIHNMRDRGFIPYRYTFSPGTYFPPHTHDHDKIAAVVSGEFRIIIGDESVILKAGDGMIVTEGVLHSAEVVGDQSVVSIDAPKG